MTAVLFYIGVGVLIGLALGEVTRGLGQWLGRPSDRVTDDTGVTDEWRWPSGR